ncbi:MAG: hypothetical protein IKB57_02020 [Bacteroidaceae bacterium]|nr:hypothetical protein [Bacteroidaceae bacterium]
MENIEDKIKKARFVKKLQATWSVANNIIGYGLIVAGIILGVKNGYQGSTHFSVFCWAAVVYFFSKYIYYPLFTNKKLHNFSEYKKFGIHFESFTSLFGNGNVLFGRFGDKLDLPHNRTISYSFLSIMYIPLIPTGRYCFLENRKMIQIDSLSTKKGGDISYNCWKFKRFDWFEVLYIYLKNWSFAVMVITVLDVIISLLLNPYMGYSNLQ